MDFNLVSLVHALGVLQGLILGVILLYKSGKNRSSWFLGLFLIGYSIEFLPVLLHDLDILTHSPQLLLLPLNLAWIVFALYYIYIQKISILAKTKITYWALYPGIISIVFQFVLFLLPQSAQDYLSQTYLFELFFILGVLYSVYLVIRINKYISEHLKEVRNQYASDKNRQLKWARFFIVFCLALVVIRIGTIFTDPTPMIHLFISCTNLILVFTIGLYGLVQYNVFSTYERITHKNPTINEETSKSNILNLINNIDNYVIENEIFTKKDLTVVDIATALEIHPRDVSKAINSHYQKNFNSYINEFRIKKAQELLKDNILENISIEGLSRDVGFHSKASFYQSFKKITGTTPKNYGDAITQTAE